MNAYEQFEKERDEFEAVEAQGFRPSPEEALDYLDAAIEAHKQGLIFSDQLYLVWQRTKRCL